MKTRVHTFPTTNAFIMYNFRTDKTRQGHLFFVLFFVLHHWDIVTVPYKSDLQNIFQ